jgi:putative transposase
MSRKPRFFRPGHVYHLISRFIDHEWFITHERERSCYVSLLGSALRDTDWRCISLAVMSNHVHLGMIAGRTMLDSWIRRVHGPFADVMNKQHGRIGSMFVRGPKDIAVPGDRVRHLLAYIHNNPVRAGVASAAVASTWTSHRAYLGLDAAPPWLHVDEGLTRAGFSNRQEFDRWVRIYATNPGTRDASPVSEIEGAELCVLGAPVQKVPDVNAVVHAVAAALCISIDALRSRRRGAAAVLARRAAVQSADALGISGAAVANALGISQQRASAILSAPCQPSQVNAIVENVVAKFAGASKL